MFQIGEVDVRGMERYGNMLGALGEQAPKAINRALNRTGDMARTQVIRALAAQTGLPQRTIRAAIGVKRSTWSDLSYVMGAVGGDVSLKYFSPRETRRGVTAAPFGRRQTFDGTFMRGGSFARGRVKLNMGGHVFERVGSSRLPIAKVYSGVVIPDEMVTGASREAFERVVEDVLPRRVDHEISRILAV